MAAKSSTDAIQLFQSQPVYNSLSSTPPTKTRTPSPKEASYRVSSLVRDLNSIHSSSSSSFPLTHPLSCSAPSGLSSGRKKAWATPAKTFLEYRIDTQKDISIVVEAIRKLANPLMGTNPVTHLIIHTLLVKDRPDILNLPRKENLVIQHEGATPLEPRATVHLPYDITNNEELEKRLRFMSERTWKWLPNTFYYLLLKTSTEAPKHFHEFVLHNQEDTGRLLKSIVDFADPIFKVNPRANIKIISLNIKDTSLLSKYHPNEHLEIQHRGPRPTLPWARNYEATYVEGHQELEKLLASISTKKWNLNAGASQYFLLEISPSVRREYLIENPEDAENVRNAISQFIRPIQGNGAKVNFKIREHFLTFSHKPPIVRNENLALKRDNEILVPEMLGEPYRHIRSNEELDTYLQSLTDRTKDWSDARKEHYILIENFEPTAPRQIPPLDNSRYHRMYLIERSLPALEECAKIDNNNEFKVLEKVLALIANLSKKDEINEVIRHFLFEELQEESLIKRVIRQLLLDKENKELKHVKTILADLLQQDITELPDVKRTIENFKNENSICFKDEINKIIDQYVIVPGTIENLLNSTPGFLNEKINTIIDQYATEEPLVKSGAIQNLLNAPRFPRELNKLIDQYVIENPTVNVENLLNEIPEFLNQKTNKIIGKIAAEEAKDVTLLKKAIRQFLLLKENKLNQVRAALADLLKDDGSELSKVKENIESFINESLMLYSEADMLVSTFIVPHDAKSITPFGRTRKAPQDCLVAMNHMPARDLSVFKETLRQYPTVRILNKEELNVYIKHLAQQIEASGRLKKFYLSVENRLPNNPETQKEFLFASRKPLKGNPASETEFFKFAREFRRLVSESYDSHGQVHLVVQTCSIHNSESEKRDLNRKTVNVMMPGYEVNTEKRTLAFSTVKPIERSIIAELFDEIREVSTAEPDRNILRSIFNPSPISQNILQIIFDRASVKRKPKEENKESPYALLDKANKVAQERTEKLLTNFRKSVSQGTKLLHIKSMEDCDELLKSFSMSDEIHYALINNLLPPISNTSNYEAANQLSKITGTFIRKYDGDSYRIQDLLNNVLILTSIKREIILNFILYIINNFDITPSLSQNTRLKSSKVAPEILASASSKWPLDSPGIAKFKALYTYLDELRDKENMPLEVYKDGHMEQIHKVFSSHSLQRKPEFTNGFEQISYVRTIQDFPIKKGWGKIQFPAPSIRKCREVAHNKLHYKKTPLLAYPFFIKAISPLKRELFTEMRNVQNKILQLKKNLDNLNTEISLCKVTGRLPDDTDSASTTTQGSATQSTKEKGSIASTAVKTGVASSTSSPKIASKTSIVLTTEASSTILTPSPTLKSRGSILKSTSMLSSSAAKSVTFVSTTKPEPMESKEPIKDNSKVPTSTRNKKTPSEIGKEEANTPAFVSSVAGKVKTIKELEDLKKLISNRLSKLQVQHSQLERNLGISGGQYMVEAIKVVILHKELKSHMKTKAAEAEQNKQPVVKYQNYDDIPTLVQQYLHFDNEKLEEYDITKHGVWSDDAWFINVFAKTLFDEFYWQIRGYIWSK